MSDRRPSEDRPGGELFTPARIVALSVAALGVVVGLHHGLQLVNTAFLGGAGEIPEHWPISIFSFHTPRLRWLVVSLPLSVAGFVAATRLVEATRNGFAVGLAGFVLAVLTTLLQGIEAGFAKPVDSEYQYYLDAAPIVDPVAFVANFGLAQPYLTVHARTHPPGAVLTFWVLDQLLPSPAWIAVAIAAIAFPLSGALLHRLLRRAYPERTALFATFLFVLLPATQVYYLATLDALVATLSIAAVLALLQDSPSVAAAGLFACLLVLSFGTFLVAFLGPVLFGVAFYHRRNRAALVAAVAGVIAVYAALAVGLGFDYLAAFQFAVAHENEAGPLFLAAPATYVFTRLEGVAELLLFFTPFLAVLSGDAAVEAGRAAVYDVRSALPSRDGPVLPTAAALAVLALGGMFLAGVYRTGETARGAMYVYPFLMVPVAAALSARDPTATDRRLLAAAVFGQTLLMQAVGHYWW